MDTVIVLEPDIPTNVRLLGPGHQPADPENPVRLAHATPAEPSGICGPLTLCGLDTAGMTLAPRRSTEGARPQPHWNACRNCRAVEEGAAPRTRTAAAPDGPAGDALPG
ncbi:hypothetical protein AB0F71_12620 [Kitasatospora sp. NPDC028055]|uniref:hypothetical protein n=1 Tax=Kitasatospora sp. NPDC028055 TaxID=3155653 RepID=UPI0033CA541D